ncbi:MAG TPA: flagellar filament capping protein FliD [Methylophilaceae bacterium]|jgi:flagellar hook-associated protein 2
MTISSTGVGSGLDVNGIVSKLMTAEAVPQDSLKTQEAAVKTQLSAYGQLNSALSALQTAVKNIATASKFNQQALTSADTSVFTATSNGSSSVSSYNIAVSQLAQSQKLATNGYTNTTDVVGTGTLTLSFPGNTSKTDVAITIDSSNNTLTGIRDAVNLSGASVTASIINDGTTNRLVFTSKDTGTINAMKITVAGDAGLSALAYDPAGTKNLTELQPAKDAKLNVDGIDIVKPSNTITDALDGVTLNLLKVSPTTTTTDGAGVTTTTYNKIGLNVTTDNTKVQAALQAFVDAYNKFNTTIKALTKFDGTATKGTVSSNNGPLLGDATVRTVTSQIKGLLTGLVNTGGTTQSSLSQVGIAFQADGTLALDSTKLNSAISSNFNTVSALFVTTGSGTSAVKGIAAQLDAKLTSYLASDGILQAKTDGYNKTIKQMDSKISDWDTKLAALQKRYLATYSALDIQLTNMNTQKDAITQETASWNANK